MNSNSNRKFESLRGRRRGQYIISGHCEIVNVVRGKEKLHMCGVDPAGERKRARALRHVYEGGLLARDPKVLAVRLGIII